MNIVSLGRLVFLVNEKYHVDMECHDLYGSCDCPDWRARKWPLIRDGAKPGELTQCKHCRWVEKYLARKLMAELAVKLKEI